MIIKFPGAAVLDMSGGLPSVANGGTIFDKLPKKYAVDLIAFMMDVVTYECRLGLGLEEITEDIEKVIEEHGLPMFEAINEVYKKAANGCYFCDHDIDPNEKKKPEKICLMCQMKLNNIGEKP